jgi:predicted nuclease of restriction endonuclease-like (RecB) superfamily
MTTFYILEFLNLKPDWKVYEKDLEQGLLDNLQNSCSNSEKGLPL